MRQIIDWVAGKFQKPVSAVLLLLGILLLLLGLVASLPLPFARLSAFDPHRPTAILLGVLFVVFAIINERSSSREAPALEEIAAKDIQTIGREVAARCDGEMHWFNVPLGRCIPPHFDQFLKPAIENDQVTRIVFMLDEIVKPTWDQFIAPAVRNVEQAIGRPSKVIALFHDFKHVKPVRHNMAFKLVNVNSPRRLKPEAHVFFYDESWMRQVSVMGQHQLIPTKMLRVRPGSELFAEIKVLCERYCFGVGSASAAPNPPAAPGG
jgi:hypothetical protein